MLRYIRLYEIFFLLFTFVYTIIVCSTEEGKSDKLYIVYMHVLPVSKGKVIRATKLLQFTTKSDFSACYLSISYLCFSVIMSALSLCPRFH